MPTMVTVAQAAKNDKSSLKSSFIRDFLS